MHTPVCVYVQDTVRLVTKKNFWKKNIKALLQSFEKSLCLFPLFVVSDLSCSPSRTWWAFIFFLLTKASVWFFLCLLYSLQMFWWYIHFGFLLASLLIPQFANCVFTMYLMKLSWHQIDVVECPGKVGYFKEERKWVGSRCRINMFYFNHFLHSFYGRNLNTNLFS